MSASYAPAEALREAMGLAGTNVFAEFCRSLEEYVHTGTGEAALRQSSGAAAIETRHRGLAPERMLHALRITSCGSRRLSPRQSLGGECDVRYSHAVRLFLRQFFTS